MSKNLPKVRTLIHKACSKWYDLGLELGIEDVTLDIIESNCHGDVETCFRKMLSEWLKMINPRPSWEGLIAALKKSYIGHKKLADEVRKEQDIPETPDAVETEADVSETHEIGW